MNEIDLYDDEEESETFEEQLQKICDEEERHGTFEERLEKTQEIIDNLTEAQMGILIKDLR